jgi:multidrug resistance efflux pump
VFTNQVDGLKGINYSQATALLVEAIKEQQKQIESYKSQLQLLQEEVEQIKAMLAKGGGN